MVPPSSISGPSPSPSWMSTNRFAMPESERCLITARVPTRSGVNLSSTLIVTSARPSGVIWMSSTVPAGTPPI